jgi:hypothetical protein
VRALELRERRHDLVMAHGDCSILKTPWIAASAP